MKIIETRKLSKTYRRVVRGEGLRGSIRSLVKRQYESREAVKNLDLTVEEGEFIGLIGPNGAGKTTLAKMLTGIIAPTGGEISVMGYYPNDLKNEFKRQYAIVMGQKSQLFFELTTNDTLGLFREIYGLSEREFRETKAYFTELFGVEKLLDVQVRTLSLGERMKLYHINDRGCRQEGPAMTPILKMDSMEPGTGCMDLVPLVEQARRAKVDAVVLESHRNWIDKSPVKSFEVSAEFLRKYV